MKFVWPSLSWKSILVLSIVTLLLLIVLSFYGIYTHKFYFFKFDNYIFPVLTIVHFMYLYILRFKIREREIGDPQMRNLEYVLYVIVVVYVFKGIEAFMVLLSYADYENHILPPSFVTMAVLSVFLHIFLLALTLSAFSLRKKFVGTYDFENINENIEPW